MNRSKTEPAQNIIEVKNLRKSYGEEEGETITVALDKVSFDVRKGEFLAIMGLYRFW